MEASESWTLDKIPTELLLVIFESLTWRDLCQLIQVR
jgi:hypothetical protein